MHMLRFQCNFPVKRLCFCFFVLLTTLLPFPADNCNSIRSSSPAPVVRNETFESSAAAKASAVAASVFSSGRRVTRSQQGAINSAAKKYPLRQSRSSGSDTEANGERAREREPTCFQCVSGDPRMSGVTNSNAQWGQHVKLAH